MTTYVQWARVANLRGDHGLVGGRVVGGHRKVIEDQIHFLQLRSTQSRVRIRKTDNLTPLQTKLDAGGAHQPFSVDHLDGNTLAQHLQVRDCSRFQRGNVLDRDHKEDGGVAKQGGTGCRSTALSQNIRGVDGQVCHDLVVVLVSDTEKGSMVDYGEKEGHLSRVSAESDSFRTTAEKDNSGSRSSSSG